MEFGLDDMKNTTSEQTAEVRGTTLTYSAEGSGPTAVWAHGLSASRDAQEQSGMFDWSPVARAGRRLVRYDARGHGHSGVTPEPADYAWSNLAGDLLALLDRIAPGETVAGIGSLMGTATLLYAAIQDPDRFDRLILTSPPTAWETRAAQSGMYLQLADLVDREGPEALAAAMSGAPMPPLFEDLLTGPMAPQICPDALATVFRGAAATDLPAPEALAGLEGPAVLILAWEGDPGHPVSTAERLAALIPGAQLRVDGTAAGVREWSRLAADFLRP